MASPVESRVQSVINSGEDAVGPDEQGDQAKADTDERGHDSSLTLVPLLLCKSRISAPRRSLKTFT